MQRHQRSNVGTESIGLLATGCSGTWSVDIDETTAGAARWFAQIEGPSVYVYFQIPSPEITGRATQFLTERPENQSSQPGSNGALVIGGDKRASVSLIRDDEFNDRYFLLIGPQDNPIVRITLAGEDLQHIVKAFRQASEDLEASA
jgi:hypothetical protein